MKTLKFILPIICLFQFSLNSLGEETCESDNKNKVIVGYVTSWSNDIPDPNLLTHINYAFGHVKDTFDGVKIDNPSRLRTITGLKEINPQLKVLLSIGGWGSGNFSEMAASDSLLRLFAKDCKLIIEDYDLDGIDIDWEYPTVSSAGISSSENDTKNFTKLIHELRSILGKDKLVTLASVASARYIDFPSILEDIDFINIMAYDMAYGNKHHAGLYPSINTGDLTSSEAIDYHIKAGVPVDKLVLGMPFYGRSSMADYRLFKDIKPDKEEFKEWDPVAKVPYLTNGRGDFLFGFDDDRSLGIKTDYALQKGLRGVMYWETSGDNENKTLSKSVHERVKNFEKKEKNNSFSSENYSANYAKAPRFKAILYYSKNVEEAHLDFALQAIDFFKRLNYGDGFILDTITSLNEIEYEKLKEYSIIISLNISPADKKEREIFEKYMENGGGWLGFHAAGYNDINTNWSWFNDFLGCGQFYCNNWPPQPALIEVNKTDSPITYNLPSMFVVPDSEFYQWNPSPANNPDVEILVSLSNKNYPFGIKDIIYDGDFPIVWRNKNYRMVYLNYGHGDREFSDATQNLLTINAFKCVVSLDPKGNPFD